MIVCSVELLLLFLFYVNCVCRYAVHVRYLTRSQYTEYLLARNIESNNTNEYLHYNWHWHVSIAVASKSYDASSANPSKATFQVEDLICLTGVEFKITSYNAIGRSSFSKPSNIVILNRDHPVCGVAVVGIPEDAVPLPCQERTMVYGMEYRLSGVSNEKANILPVLQALIL